MRKICTEQHDMKLTYEIALKSMEIRIQAYELYLNSFGIEESLEDPIGCPRMWKYGTNADGTPDWTSVEVSHRDIFKKK